MPRLKTLKLGGLTGISDSGINSLVSMSPSLQLLELNNIDRLSENVIDSITKVFFNKKRNLIIQFVPHIHIVLLNFTPGIAEEALINARKAFPNINFIRNINTMTDLKDDGLRMPLPLKSVVMERPKKKKKKK